MKTVQLEGQMSLADGEGITGEWMMKEAMMWRYHNLSAWSAMKRIACDYIAQKRRFSMEKLIQAARYDMYTNGTSQGFKVNNNLRSPLARLLVKEMPAAKPYIEMRSSKVDWL